jgi:hypothetical protein
MKQTIRDVLDDMSDSQINLASDAARETVSNLISVALKTKGSYTEYGDDEIEEQNARETWVCSICGKNTFEVDYDYIGSGTNHLGCELELEIDKKSYINDEVDETDKDKKVDWFDDADYYTGPKPREKNWSQKKHEDKVFGNVQKQLYNEMTSDGLPEGGDSQAVLESYKLAEEIVDNKDEKYIYESPDGGKTVFRRPFSEYDTSKKEEIDWETKEPTGRKFIDYPFDE